MKGTCDSCQFYTEVKEYPSLQVGEPKKLCALCANTFAGNTLDYPSQYCDPVVMQQINFVANVILASLGVQLVIPEDPDED